MAVPTSTLEIGQAERVCHMMRYTTAEFRRAAASNGWDGAVAEMALAKAAERSNAAATGDRGEARARYRDGSLNDSQGWVEVWEVFYDTSDAGRRMCALSPDVPDRPLDDRPWTWVALVGAETGPPVRPWPFVQFRNEDTIGFYNTRGLPDILEVDQKEASTYRTTRAIAIDFAGKPFLSGYLKATGKCCEKKYGIALSDTETLPPRLGLRATLTIARKFIIAIIEKGREDGGVGEL